jgi:MFS family permease
MWAVILGTFTLRFSTGLTGALLIYYLAKLPEHGGPEVDALANGILLAMFFAAELVLSTPFGLVSDRLGHHRVMQIGPIFGAVAVVLTWSTTNLFLLGGTRLLEGASTAASVPSILGFIAAVSVGDELLRGRAAARFEGATLAGLGVGLVAAGPLYEVFGRSAFLLNALVYGVSFCIYRFGVDPAEEQVAARAAAADGSPLPAPARTRTWGQYVAVLRSSSVLVLAPTWIAINAVLGLWTTGSIFNLIKKPDPHFADQLLMGRFAPMHVSIGIGVALLVLFVGLGYWGERFRRIRRTTIIFYGLLGGAAIAAAALALNHSEGWPEIARVGPVLVVLAGVFVLAGATPAALGLLADTSEAHPADRGAIMGLYSVFLALGQISGSLIGGVAAKFQGLDGIIALTFLLLGIALAPLSRLRAVEHMLEPLVGAPLEAHGHGRGHESVAD